MVRVMWFGVGEGAVRDGGDIVRGDEGDLAGDGGGGDLGVLLDSGEVGAFGKVFFGLCCCQPVPRMTDGCLSERKDLITHEPAGAENCPFEPRSFEVGMHLAQWGLPALHAARAQQNESLNPILLCEVHECYHWGQRI